MLDFLYEDTKALDIDPDFFVSWLNDVCDNENVELGEITVVLCSDEYILKANNKFLNHDYYTDIITFDYREEDVISGDLLISVDRVKDNAQKLGVDFDNELKRVIVHGVLHIIGYKDKAVSEEKLMREKESYYLSFT